jgi:asparagine synthetase B (glutamine-hydrolysing)
VWSIKPELNLSKKGEKKLVLKKIAMELKTPEIAYERPKKAMQYGSGIHKFLISAVRKNLIS